MNKPAKSTIPLGFDFILDNIIPKFSSIGIELSIIIISFFSGVSEPYLFKANLISIFSS